MRFLPPFHLVVALSAATSIVIAQDAGTNPKPAPAAPTGPANGSSRPQSQGNRIPTLDELFATLDTNHDGKISKEEATGIYAQRFAQWDANGDGFATREEIHNYRLSLGIDDNGQRIARSNPGGANAAPATAGNGGGNRPTPVANVLKEPADWRLENLPIPPTFAPDIHLAGSEEIRFAPGMFDTKSSSYFTCILAITADGAPKFGDAEIKDFLEKYYRGLSISRGRRSGLSPDPAVMQATVTPAPAGAESSNHFLAEVTFIDSFSDGRKITLHVEGQVIPRPVSKQTCLLLLVSPSPKESAEWQTLREIGKKSL